MAADDRGCFVGVVKGKGRRGLARAWGLQAIGRARHDEGNSWQSGTTSRLGPLEDRDTTRKLFIQGPAKKGLAGRGCLRNERERDERDARPQLDAAVIGHRHRLVTFPCRKICPRGLSFTPSSSSNAIIAPAFITASLHLRGRRSDSLCYMHVLAQAAGSFDCSADSSCSPSCTT